MPRPRTEKDVEDLAVNQPLPIACRELLARLKSAGEITIGHVTAAFAPAGKGRQGCTPGQAKALVARGLAETARPDPRGPKLLRPLPIAFKMGLWLALCLLVCSCGVEGGSNAPEPA